MKLYAVCSFTARLFLSLPELDSRQYHNLLPWTTGHQVHLNAYTYLQNMVNFVVSLSIRIRPSKFINVKMWEHWAFDKHIFWMWQNLLPYLHYYHLFHSTFSVWKYLSYLLWHWNFLTKFSDGFYGIFRIPVLIFLRIRLSYHQYYSLFAHEHSERLYHTSDVLVLCTSSCH
jgi:hypothetical protein